MHVVSDCQEQFNFVIPSVQLARRAEKFVNRLHVDYVYLGLFFCVFLCATSFWWIKDYIVIFAQWCKMPKGYKNRS